MSGFLRQYVTISVVAAVVSAIAVAVVAAGQVLRPQARTPQPPAAPRPGHGLRATATAAVPPRHPAGLVLAVTVCGAGVLLAPWAVTAGVLSGGELATGLVAAVAVAAGVVAAAR